MSAMAATRGSKIPAVNSNLGRKSTQTPQNNRSPTPSQIPQSPTANGIGRRHTLREGMHNTAPPNGVGHASNGSISSLRNGITARSAVKRPPTSNSSDTASEADLEAVVLIEDLREQLKRSEANAQLTTEEYGRELKGLQVRLGETLGEASKMEELLHAKDEIIENFELQVKDLQRAKREQENAYGAERISTNKEKEEMLEKEEELNATIQRLKDMLAQRERASDSEASSGRSSSAADEEVLQFAPSSGRATPRHNNLLLQKDKLIESLRLELAEAHIKLTEMDHMGGSKLQELEQRLTEARLANARLMEDNESFQLLLSTATLNGDFTGGDLIANTFSEDHDREDERGSCFKKDNDNQSVHNEIALGSLADELEGAEEAEADKTRKLETEVKSLKDQNKALTLYINNIIERLLQHKDFETILDKTPSLGSIQSNLPKGDTDKALPPPPPVEEPQSPGLSRSKSRSTAKPVPKLPVNPPTPPNKDQDPNQPLQRSQSMRVAPTGLRHKRSKSENLGAYTGGANLVNTMYRKEFGALPRVSTALGGDTYTARPSRFSVASSASVSSTASDAYSGEVSSPTTPHNSGPVGMIVGKQLRPLRLVQENVGGGLKSPVFEAEDKEKKQNKRNSWMGWFNRGKEEPIPTPTSATSTKTDIVFERKDIE